MKSINCILMSIILIMHTPNFVQAQNTINKKQSNVVAHILLAEKNVDVVRNRKPVLHGSQGELWVNDTIYSSGSTQIIFTDNTSLNLGSGTEISIQDVQPGLLYLNIRQGIVRVVPGSAEHQVHLSTPHGELWANGAAMLLPEVAEAHSSLTMIAHMSNTSNTSHTSNTSNSGQPDRGPALRVTNSLTGVSSVLSTIKSPSQSVQMSKEGTRVGISSADERGYLHSALRPAQVSFQGQSAGSQNAEGIQTQAPNAKASPTPFSLANLGRTGTAAGTLGSFRSQVALLGEIASFTRGNYVQDVSNELLQTELKPSQPAVPSPAPPEPPTPPDLPPLVPPLPDPGEPPDLFPLDFKNLAAEYQGNLVGADLFGNELDGDFNFKLNVQSGLIEHIGLELRPSGGLGEPVGADASGAWQIVLGDAMFTFDVDSLPLFYLFDMAPNEESGLWLEGSISPDGQKINIDQWLHDAYDKNAFKEILGSGQGQGSAVK